MKKTYITILILLTVHLFFLANLRFTAWPEMLSYAYLRNNGFLLYKDMIHPYPPLLTMGLSYIYSIFGYGLGVLQSVAWLTSLASGVLVFLITRQITGNDKPALIALAVYVFLQPFLEGNMLWFDLAIVPPILLGTLFTLRWLEKEGRPEHNIFLASFSFSLATLIKQTAGIFLILLFFFILMKRVKLGSLARFILAPLILVVPFLIRLLQEGALQDFLNWTLVYPLTEWGSYPGYVEMSLAPRELMILVVLALPVVLLLLKERLTVFKRSDFSLVFLFFCSSVLIVYPRFSFFHFQPALAFLAILFGYIWQKAERKTALLTAAGISALLLLGMVHEPTIIRDAQKEARFYGKDDIEMARIIAEEVPEEEKVYLLGLHSGLYAIAERVPPKRWTDNFGWYLEIPGVQEGIISRWEKDPPAAIFWQDPEPGEWYELGTYQPQKIVRWIEANYTKKEEVKPGVWLWVLRQAQDKQSLSFQDKIQ